MISEEIEIEDPSFPALGPCSSQFSFDLVEPLQQLVGRQVGVGSQHAVDEIRLIRYRNRTGAIPMGALVYLDPQFAHADKGSLERFARATKSARKICPEGDEDHISGLHRNKRNDAKD